MIAALALLALGLSSLVAQALPAAARQAEGLSHGAAVLLDEVVEAPASGWRAVEVSLPQRPAILECRFNVVRGRSGVRLALLRREELGRFRGGHSHRVVLATGFERRGDFRCAPGPGEYALLIDNRLEGRGPAAVQLRVALEFPPAALPPARELSPGRRLAVILVSLAVFATLAGFAARRLSRALRSVRRTPG